MRTIQSIFPCCARKSKLGPRNPPCFGMHMEGLLRGLAVVHSLAGTSYCLTYCLIGILPMMEVIDEAIRRILGWCTFSGHLIISIALDVVLYSKAKSPHTFHLSVYIYYTWVSIPVILFYVVWWTYCDLASLSFRTKCLVPSYLVFKSYICFVIWRYTDEIKFSKIVLDGYRDLNEEEIFEFMEGRKDFNNLTSEIPLEEKASYEKYKKDDYEIPMEELDFDNSTLLGSGEYGCVHGVNICRRNGNGTSYNCTVAVKTVDPTLTDAHCFLAILSEAKTLIYLGEHKNIVKLIGLCTQEICSRKLYIVCELCAFGNLRSYLLSEKASFINQPLVKGNNGDLSAIASLSLQDLIRWCYEIACGMEFLASKKVIHGDLAARNVLLTESRTVKITDFGLSRRLYNYSIYVKHQNSPLPWRWLAVESLVDMNFSTCSDVWSYGICCWEIFDLGKHPWPQYTQYSMEFIHDLKNGIRLGKPNFSDDMIFGTVIRPCWNSDPSSRPTFANIMSNLKPLLPDDNQG